MPRSRGGASCGKQRAELYRDEADGFRPVLLRGRIAALDDIADEHWYELEAQLERSGQTVPPAPGVVPPLLTGKQLRRLRRALKWGYAMTGSIAYVNDRVAEMWEAELIAIPEQAAKLLLDVFRRQLGKDRIRSFLEGGA